MDPGRPMVRSFTLTGCVFLCCLVKADVKALGRYLWPVVCVSLKSVFRRRERERERERERGSESSLIRHIPYFQYVHGLIAHILTQKTYPLAAMLSTFFVTVPTEKVMRATSGAT